VAAAEAARLDFFGTSLLNRMASAHIGGSRILRGRRRLEESIDRGTLGTIKVEPLFHPHRDDPRFQALLARRGLAD